MSKTHELRALSLTVLLVLSAFVGSIAFSGTVAAATNTSITPDDDNAGATDVQYEADGHFELDNQDTLQYVDVHLSPADVSSVGSGDVTIFIDGNEYQDGFSQFSTSSGTVEFKLANSRSISDGDRVRVVVADVTNPSDDFEANATFHDTGDAKFQTYQDTVSIDTPANVQYSDLGFDDGESSANDTTIDVGEGLDVSATIENTGEQSGTYNASLEIDGTVVRWHNGTIAGGATKTTTFTESFASTGTSDVGIVDLGPTEVTVTGPLSIADGSAAPDTVAPGTTVNNQKVYVDVANVSQDGDTDWHYVEFPNALASGLAVNSVDANATSITSSPNLVDGFDDDGTAETVKFATSGDGGGDIPLNLTVDASIDYPDTETTYDVDARTEDSGGDVAERNGVATIQATESPTPLINDFTATNPTARDVVVAFDADEQVSQITVDLADGTGTTVATLTEADFSESASGGEYMYEATYGVSSDGQYTATLTDAADADGNDGASGQSDTVTVDSATTLIADGSASPSVVTPGETVSNQQVTVDLAAVSADGDTDWHYVEFPNALASGLSVNSVSANATSITSSPNLVDGFDDDGTAETVRFATSADGGGNVDLAITVDASVAYPNTETSYEIDAMLEGSQAGRLTESGVASVSAVASDDGSSGGSDDGSMGLPGFEIDPMTPQVTGIDLVRENRSLTVAVSSDRAVSTLDVSIEGPVDTDLAESDFGVHREGEDYVYTTEVFPQVTGSYDATVERIAADGTSGPAGQNATAVLPLYDYVAPTSVAAPPWVGDADSAHSYTVAVADESGVTNETLSAVDVQYGDAFLNASGSISSVSDDQNVARLLVVDSDGTVQSRMGDTDAVTVDVANDSVQLDLSDVDSSRKPTLEVGDRVVVRIRPVTNPETAGTYDAAVRLETAAGASERLATDLEIMNRDAVDAYGVGYVAPAEERVSVDLQGSDSLGPVTVGSVADAAGTVRVSAPDDAPAITDDLSRPVVSTLAIRRPDAALDESATVTVDVDADEFSGDASALALLRYDDADDSWNRLNTSVVGRDDGDVTIRATASGTSTFAITGAGSQQEQQTTTQPSDDQQSDDQQATTQTTQQPTTEADQSTPDEGTTTSSGPGFGLAVTLVVVALLGAALVARYRGRRD